MSMPRTRGAIWKKFCASTIMAPIPFCAAMSSAATRVAQHTPRDTLHAVMIWGTSWGRMIFRKISRFVGAQGLPRPDIEGVQTHQGLVDDDHGREKSGIAQDDDLGGLTDAEENDHEGDERDRRQGPEEIDHRVQEQPHDPEPPDQESEDDRQHDPDGEAAEHPHEARVNVHLQAAVS